MPELPEVETVRQHLLVLVGATVQQAHVATPGFCPGWQPGDIAGDEIQAVERHGKHLLLHTRRGLLASHLRMTGKLLITAPGEEPYTTAHRHAWLRFNDGRMLHAVDPRRFGYLAYSTDAGALLARLGLPALGPDAYTAAPTGQQLAARAGKTARGIKAVLLDQSVVAGLGNIYVDEILYAARVHPHTAANALQAEQWEALAHASQGIIAAAVAAGGTTVRDYRSSWGHPGSYQQQLAVYGRGGLPCVRCGAPLATTRSAGRTTVYCAVCQGAKDKT